MIDIENEVFTLIAKALRAKFNPIFITGEYLNAPPSFPCVSLIEMDNRTHFKTQSSESSENHVQVVYEVGVYTNKAQGKKQEAKAIIASVDTLFSDLGFNRVSLNPIPNPKDTGVYRLVARYRGVVSKDRVIFRR